MHILFFNDNLYLTEITFTFFLSNKNFIGLTGELDQIYKFATQVNAPFMPVADTSDPYYTVDHTGSIVILSSEGRYAGFFRAPHNKENIIKALNALVNQNK